MPGSIDPSAPFFSSIAGQAALQGGAARSLKSKEKKMYENLIFFCVKE